MYQKFMLFLSRFDEGEIALIYFVILVIFFACISWAINVLMFGQEE